MLNCYHNIHTCCCFLFYYCSGAAKVRRGRRGGDGPCKMWGVRTSSCFTSCFAPADHARLLDTYIVNYYGCSERANSVYSSFLHFLCGRRLWSTSWTKYYFAGEDVIFLFVAKSSTHPCREKGTIRRNIKQTTCKLYIKKKSCTVSETCQWLAEFLVCKMLLMYVLKKTFLFSYADS